MGSSQFIVGDWKNTEKTTTQPAEEDYLSPGGTVTERGLPDKNTWDFDSSVFMEITIPVFAAKDIWLDPPVGGQPESYGDWVPVITFNPDLSWIEVESEIENGARRTVWMYEKTVATGKSFTPLYTEVSMPNFHASNGVCGNLNYFTDIAPKVENIQIVRHSLQGTMKGTLEQLWTLVR